MVQATNRAALAGRLVVATVTVVMAMTTTGCSTAPTAGLQPISVAAPGSVPGEKTGGAMNSLSEDSTNPPVTLEGGTAPAGASAPAVQKQPLDTDLPTFPTGTGKVPDICKTLPLATVSRIANSSFGSAKSSAYGGIITTCSYDAASTDLEVAVTMIDGKSAMKEDMDIAASMGHPLTVVSGVGDAAFSAPEPKGNAGSIAIAASGSYGALFGDVYIKISGLTYVDQAQGREIVMLVHTAL